MNTKRLLEGILKRTSRFWSDKIYLQLRYRISLGKKLNLDSPETFSEKIQWLKLYNRKHEYTKMVDKFAVRQYVSSKIGSRYLIPILAVFEDANSINFDNLPNQFVLKTTHGGGSTGVVICKDKIELDIEAAKRKLTDSLNENIYYNHREWPYKYVPRMVIAETYMKDEKTEELNDYKFFCFNGVPKFCQLISDRHSGEKIDFYDMNWKRLVGLVGLNPKAINSPTTQQKPSTFDEMQSVASKLSEGIPFVRVDLYEINGKCYFGEITFFPASGFGLFRPDEWNKIMGDLIILPEKQNVC